MELKLGQDKKKLEEKKHQEDAFMKDLSNSMKNIEKRYFDIQKSFHSLDVTVDDRDNSWDESITEFTNQLEEIKKDVAQIQEKANESVNLMKKIIVRFKNSSKKDEFNQISERIDSLKMEDYITKESFRKMLLEEIDRRL